MNLKTDANKMAAFLSVEQVLEEVLRDDEEVSEEEEVVDEEDKEKESLREFLGKFESDREFDREFFIEKSAEVILPILKAASITRSDAAHLCTSTISSASVLQQEGKLWLNSIQRRLGGRVSVKQPYYGEVHRNIPLEIFNEVTRLIKRSASAYFQEPHCIIGTNRKAVVVSFTSLASLVKVFELLTGNSTGQVKKFFSRVLKNASRYGHKVKLLVSDNKDFAFVYKYSSGQLTLQFHYGEWNTCGGPRHPNPTNNEQ